MTTSLSMVRYVGAAARVVVLKAIRDRVSAIVPDTMPGCCAITSYVLRRALKKIGTDAEFVSGYFMRAHRVLPHCWIEVDGRIVDATASQFGVRSAVYVPRDRGDYCGILKGPRAIGIARANHKSLGLFDDGNRLANRVIAIAIGEHLTRREERALCQ